MALLTCAVTLAAIAGCEPDRVVGSQMLGNRVSAVVYPESVSVRTLCGARVVIENHNDGAVAVSYALSPGGSQTQLTLKARLPGLASSDEYLVLTASSGTLYLRSGAVTQQVTFPQVSCPSGPVVPATPPAGVEASLLKAGRVYWAPDSRRGNQLLSLRRFWVGFKDGTAASVRQALFDRLGATVLAGTGTGSMGEGDYLIQMPLPLDSGTIARDRVWNLLLSCSTVVRVGPDGELRVVPSGLAPRDGAGWRNWLLDSVSTAHNGWYLEMGRFPLAWGCSIGTTSTTIATLDLGLIAAQDVNVVTANGVNTSAGFHATRVASIIAARGNNDSGIVGGAWAGVRTIFHDMHDTTSSLNMPLPQRGNSDVLQAMQRAILSHARVVNLSIAIQDSLAAPNSLDRLKDSVKMIKEARNFAQMGRNAWLDTASRRPLLVMSAGNHPYDAWWTLFATMRPIDTTNFWSDKSIVVGGMAYTKTPMFWNSSGNGPLIDIVAPAEHLEAAQGGNTVGVDNGVSFAVPQVTAAAALLLSLDSTLTAADLRSLLISGAVVGGRTVQVGSRSVPVLDAYASLKLLAQRKGLPLCGNRVWADGRTVRIERGTGAPDSLPSNSSPVVDLFTYHGGRKIAVTLANGSRNFYSLSAGTWTLSQNAFVDSFATTVSGAARSATGFSHDSLTRLLVSLVNADLSFADTTQPQLGIELDDQFGTPTWLTTWAVPQSQPALSTVRHAYSVVQAVGLMMPVPATGSLVAARRTARGQIGNPDTSWFELRNQLNLVSRPAWAVDPMGRYAYVAINQQLTRVTGVQSSYRVNCFQPLPDNGCRTVSFAQTTAGVVLVRVNLSTQAVDTLWRDPTANAHALAVSEGGDEISFTLARDTVTWNAAKDSAASAGPWYLQDWQGFTPLSASGPCYAGFRKLSSITTDSTYRSIAPGCSTTFKNHGNTLSSFGLVARTRPSRVDPARRQNGPVRR